MADGTMADGTGGSGEAAALAALAAECQRLADAAGTRLPAVRLLRAELGIGLAAATEWFDLRCRRPGAPPSRAEGPAARADAWRETVRDLYDDLHGPGWSGSPEARRLAGRLVRMMEARHPGHFGAAADAAPTDLG